MSDHVDIDEQKLEEIRLKIKEGFYSRRDVLEKMAARLVKKLFFTN